MSTATLDKTSYATVISSTGKHGYSVAARIGSVVTITHLGGGSPEDLRASAQTMYPDRLIVMPGDPTPW